MMPRLSLSALICCSVLCVSLTAEGQTLSMKDAVNTAVANYGTIKAKTNYVSASREAVSQSRREYLPNVNIAAQNDYGTVNGQTGPLAPFGGAINAASSGPTLPNQNWNAAFGALYLSNFNWEFFTFGRIRERIKVSKATLSRDEKDLGQEIFQHQIRVSAAYLNLLAAQRLTISQQRNLERAIVFKDNAVVRAKNGLIAGVDSTLASAQVSSARIALTKSIDLQQEQANRLGILMGMTATDYQLDTNFVKRVPQAIMSTDTAATLSEHPTLQYYRKRVDLSNEQVNYFKRLAYPTFSFMGVFQGRASGFGADYNLNLSSYTRNYFDGVNPTRANYLLGVGLTWNLGAILKTAPQVNAQRYTTYGLQNEYELADQQLHAQLALSETKIRNAMANYMEAPEQVKAAQQAYLQKSTLYKNGLTTLVDLTQALFVLNRAETDRDIAYANVWQALLMKSAAMGDYNVFINEF